jgi:hypothetical protein
LHLCTQLNVACHQHGIMSPSRCGGLYACGCEGSTVFTSSVPSRWTCQFLSILLPLQQPFRLPNFQAGTLSRIISQLNGYNPAQVQAESHTMASLSRHNHSLHVQAICQVAAQVCTVDKQATQCSMWRRARSLLAAPAVGTACWHHCQP